MDEKPTFRKQFAGGGARASPTRLYLAPRGSVVIAQHNIVEKERDVVPLADE